MKSSKIYGKNVSSKMLLYNHFNGRTYYSLYDNHGIWQGYINSTGVKKSGESAEGMAISSNKYVTINSKNYFHRAEFLYGKKKRKVRIVRKKRIKSNAIISHFNGKVPIYSYIR